MNSFTFNKINSSYYGIYISKKDIYSAPVRDQIFESIPGRSGDIIIDNKRYKNIDISYTCSFTNLKERATKIKQWLCQSAGYLELKDSYQPSYYRKACFSSKLDIEEIISNVGTAKLVFNCKPYLYRLSGNDPVTLTEAGSLTNFDYESEPIIQIFGSGDVTLHINDKSYSMSTISPSITLDSELMSAYRDSTLLNHKIKFTEFPILATGTNNISWTGNVTKVVITPRWRML